MSDGILIFDRRTSVACIPYAYGFFPLVWLTSPFCTGYDIRSETIIPLMTRFVRLLHLMYYSLNRSESSPFILRPVYTARFPLFLSTWLICTFFSLSLLFPYVLFSYLSWCTWPSKLFDVVSGPRRRVVDPIMLPLY